MAKDFPFGKGYTVFNYYEDGSLRPKNFAEAYSGSQDDGDTITEDISGWKTYNNPKFNLSFKYNPAWKVNEPIKKGDYDILVINPGKKNYNIKIYISKIDYFSLTSVPTTKEKIAGVEAFNSKGLLYGLANNNTYYTFDIGYSLKLKPDFMAMVHSVKFE